jgi:hypothetical protein
MKRAWPLAVFLACASNEAPPPHNEVAAAPSASPSSSPSTNVVATTTTSSAPTDDGENVTFGGSGIGLGSVVIDAGPGQGFGNGHGRLGGSHVGTDAGAGGRIAPEVIQRIVRASFGQTKTC